jgi:hypothetical protein
MDERHWEGPSAASGWKLQEGADAEVTGSDGGGCLLGCEQAEGNGDNAGHRAG